MLGLGGVPSFIMFIGFFFMPETPRWLVFKRKIDKARAVLAKVRQHHEVEAELKMIIQDHEDHTKSQKSKYYCHLVYLLWKSGIGTPIIMTVFLF